MDFSKKKRKELENWELQRMPGFQSHRRPEGNRLVGTASADNQCSMHYRCNAGPHTHTWRENGGRGYGRDGVDSIFPPLSLSLSLSLSLASYLLELRRPMDQPPSLMSLSEQRASLDNISIERRRYCFRIFMVGLVGIVLKDKGERNATIGWLRSPSPFHHAHLAYRALSREYPGRLRSF